MGHIAPEAAKQLVKNGVVMGIDLDELSPIMSCDSCVHVKMTHTPVPKEHEGDQATDIGSEIHTDVWGLSPIKTMGGRAYYISFTNDKSRYMQVHLLNRKM